MQHGILLVFLVTLIAGLISLFNAAVIFLRTKDTIIRYFLILFSGLSGQILAHLCIGYFLIAGGSPASPLFRALLALVGLSMSFMAIAIIRSTDLFCGGRGAGSWDIAAIVVSALGFFLCLFSYTVDPEAGVVRFNALRLALLILPASILYAIARGLLFLRTEIAGERRSCIRAMTVLALVFLPFFCLSFSRPVIAGSMKIGVNMFSVLPFSAFYLAICAAFTVFINKKYFKLLSATGPSSDTDPPVYPDAAFYRDHGISAREQEVMALILVGQDNKSIARKLGISVNTVKVHTSSIFRKLGVQSRFELTKFRAANSPYTEGLPR
jgi:DNA-binding CsgD family transcriptional regulator